MKQKGSQYKVAVFDMDNTLIDSARKLKHDVVDTFYRLGVNIPLAQIKGDWYKLAESYGVDRNVFDKEFENRKSWEESLEAGEVPIFSDTVPCLEKLSQEGIRMAVLSKSIPEYTRAKLDYFNLNKYFEQVETVHPRVSGKREGAINLIKRMNPSTIKETYCIGDKPEDVVIEKDIYRMGFKSLTPFRIIPEIETKGIYLNRRKLKVPKEVRGNIRVASLKRVPKIIEKGLLNFSEKMEILAKQRVFDHFPPLPF